MNTEIRLSKGPRPENLGLSALTPREKQVLVGISRGMSNQEIATKLGISPNTAKRFVTNICNALGMRSRTKLAAFVWGLKVEKRDRYIAELESQVARLKNLASRRPKAVLSQP